MEHIGEEVMRPPGWKDPYHVLEVDRSFGKVLRSSMRLFGLIFILFGTIFAIMLLYMLYIMIDNGYLAISLVFSFFFLMIPVIVFVLMVCMFRDSMKNNRIEFDDEMMVVHHQSSFNMPILVNPISWSNVGSIRPAGIGFRMDRKERTAWSNRFLFVPNPPAGGLYSPFADYDDLLVVNLKEPILVNNYGHLGKPTKKKGSLFSGSMQTIRRYLVREILIDVQKKDHFRLMKRVLE